MNKQAEITIDGERGARLRTCRKSIGLTQEHFAELGGVSLNTQNRYEAGALPSSDYLLKLGRHDIDWVWIMTGRPFSDTLPADASELVSAFISMPPEFQHALMIYVRAFHDALFRHGLPERKSAPEDGTSELGVKVD